MNITISPAKIYSYISEFLCMTLLFLLFKQYTGTNGNIIFYYLKIIISLYLWVYCLFTQKYKKSEILIIFLISAYIIVFSFLGNGNLQSVITHLPIVLFLLKKENLKKKMWVIMPIVIAINVIITWLKSPNKYILYPGISRNYVSIFLIYAFSLLNIRYEKSKQNFPITLIIVLWIVSISALGRGGIIASSSILILFLIQKVFYKNSNKAHIRILKIVASMILLSILIYIAFFNLEYIQKTFFGRFFGYESSSSSSDSSRMLMIVSYIEYCFNSVRALLMGADASMISLVHSNLHNSYLQIHSQFGLIGFLFILISIIKSISYLLKNKLYSSLFIFIGVLVRAATDWCFPGFPLEIILLYYALMPYFTENRVYKKLNC